MKAGRALVVGTGMTLIAAAGCADGTGTPAPRTPEYHPAGCAPPSSTYRVIHPARVSTARPAVSPPIRSLPPSTAAPPATPREIPLGRIKPWSERCPPPPPASGGGS